MALFAATAVEDLPEGTSVIVQVQGRSIGVYNVKGEYYAIHNYCPHQGAQLCKGPVCGTTLQSPVYEYIYGRDQEILRCPWHGWEFDLKTGKSLFGGRVRARIYPVRVVDGKVCIVLGSEEGEDQRESGR